jgi:hypothetical protein
MVSYRAAPVGWSIWSLAVEATQLGVKDGIGLTAARVDPPQEIIPTSINQARTWRRLNLRSIGS